MENKNTIYIFTDGSSLGNPGRGGFGVILIFNEKVKELGGGEKQTTNNRMELSGAISALQHIGGVNEVAFARLPADSGAPRKIILYTDSSYVINGITKWIWGWKKNDWKTAMKADVSNRDLWEELLRVSSGKKIEWKHIGGHVGIPGNERTDEIAVSFSAGKPEKLFDGKLSDYGIKNILDTSYDEEQIKKRRTDDARKKAKAYSYVSMIDGNIMTHETWAECERRVKGKSAKYKKAVSKEDEEKIMREWRG
jgi:ribonuclease HI